MSDWSSPVSIQTIYDVCKAKEGENETLKSTEVYGETKEGLLVKAIYKDDTKNYVTRIERMVVKV